MNLKLFIPVIFSALSTGFAQTRTPQEIVAQKCGVESNEPAQRVFAKIDDKQPWREFRHVADVPELSLGFGTSAEMWSGRNHRLLIRTEEPGEDFDAYTEYCFGQDRRLLQVAYELRTAWGWGFRMNGTVLNGTLHTDSKVYFNTETGKQMPRPDGADDIREALRPSLFLTVKRLPFSQLLSK